MPNADNYSVSLKSNRYGKADLILKNSRAAGFKSYEITNLAIKCSTLLFVVINGKYQSFKVQSTLRALIKITKEQQAKMSYNIKWR